MRASILVVLGGMALALILGFHFHRQQNRPTMAQQEFVRRLRTSTNMLVLDVRSSEEFAKGYIPGAINIPYRDLPERLGEIWAYHDKDVVVYCERGVRARIAEDTLRTAGFSRVQHLEGDMGKWRRAALPVVMASGKF